MAGDPRACLGLTSLMGLMLPESVVSERNRRLADGMPEARGGRWRDVALLAYGRSFDHPAKVRIVRWLTRRLVADRLIVRYAGDALIAIDPADYVGWTIFRTGHYEPASLRLALRLMAEEPGLFVDVGANFGWYTCAVAATAGYTVISIEPDCENCARLRRNIALGNLHNVVIFSGALGARVGLVRMIMRSRGNSGTAAIPRDDEEPSRRDGWVSITPTDALLKQVADPPVRPTLIKIDVEGFEPEVLAGLDFDGPFRPRNILLEFDSVLSVRGWGSFHNLQTFFADRCYDLLDVLGNPLRDAAAIPEYNVWARERLPAAAKS
jgi:FkbM family methyltransferase